MNIPHPWSWVPERKQGPLFLFALLLTLAVLLALQALGAPLRSDAAPAGIISYELAGTLTAAQEVLESWGPQGRTYAGVNLGLDYLFLCAYAVSIGLACILVGRRFKPRSPLHTVGVLLSWPWSWRPPWMRSRTMLSFACCSAQRWRPVSLARSAALVSSCWSFSGSSTRFWPDWRPASSSPESRAPPADHSTTRSAGLLFWVEIVRIGTSY